jgi:hypothetical protein
VELAGQRRKGAGKYLHSIGARAVKAMIRDAIRANIMMMGRAVTCRIKHLGDIARLGAALGVAIDRAVFRPMHVQDAALSVYVKEPAAMIHGGIDGPANHVRDEQEYGQRYLKMSIHSREPTASPDLLSTHSWRLLAFPGCNGRRLFIEKHLNRWYIFIRMGMESPETAFVG